eukprot:1897700-Pyramimonas_sp.AAC.1
MFDYLFDFPPVRGHARPARKGRGKAPEKHPCFSKNAGLVRRCRPAPSKKQPHSKKFSPLTPCPEVRRIATSITTL